MKKEYKAPTIVSEPIKIGVFGCYGTGGGPGVNTPPSTKYPTHFPIRYRNNWWWF